MSNLPPKPEFGEFQTAEWSDDYGFWVIRDLTPEELAVKFPEPEPDPNAPIPPIVISSRQGKQALLDNNLFDTVEAFIYSENDKSLEIWWTDAREWEEDHPKILAMMNELNINEADAKSMFEYAKTL